MLWVTSLFDEIVSRVLNNLVKAHRFVCEALGVSIPREELAKVFEEVEHVAIHELVHGVVRRVYPGMEELYHEDEVLAECVDEVGARMLELYVSSRVGVYTHSFEEHVHELEHYTNLRDLGVEARDLEELYREFEKLVEEKKLGDALDAVVRKCMEWKHRLKNPRTALQHRDRYRLA